MHLKLSVSSRFSVKWTACTAYTHYPYYLLNLGYVPGKLGSPAIPSNGWYLYLIAHSWRWFMTWFLLVSLSLLKMRRERRIQNFQCQNRNISGCAIFVSKCCKSANKPSLWEKLSKSILVTIWSRGILVWSVWIWIRRQSELRGDNKKSPLRPALP